MIVLNNVKHLVGCFIHVTTQEIFHRIMQLDMAYFWAQLVWRLVLYALHLSRCLVLFLYFLS